MWAVLAVVLGVHVARAATGCVAAAESLYRREVIKSAMNAYFDQMNMTSGKHTRLLGDYKDGSIMSHRGEEEWNDFASSCKSSGGRWCSNMETSYEWKATSGEWNRARGTTGMCFAKECCTGSSCTVFGTAVEDQLRSGLQSVVERECQLGHDLMCGKKFKEAVLGVSAPCGTGSDTGLIVGLVVFFLVLFVAAGVMWYRWDDVSAMASALCVRSQDTVEGYQDMGATAEEEDLLVEGEQAPTAAAAPESEEKDEPQHFA